MAKPTREELLRLGLPAPAAVAPGQLVASVDIATGKIFLSPHNLFTDTPITFRLETDTTLGAVAGALPGGLSEGVTYYAAPVTADAFRVATSAGGSPMTSFSADPVGSFSFVLDPGSALDQAIDDADATVDALCTAHGASVNAPVVLVAKKYLAAQLYVAHMAAGDPATAESYNGITALWALTYKPLLDAYFRGVPVKGATDSTPTISEGSPQYRVLGPAAPTATSWGTSSAEVV